MELNLLTLTAVLEKANGSERGAEQKLAENQLKEWEIQPGYHYLLQNVYTDLSIPLQIRWLAIINFKNGVEKYWRTSKVNAISKDEKQQIKLKLFEMIDEPNKQLSIQNSQAISRICRFEFPAEWPTLIDELEILLQTSIKEENNVKIHNLLIILNQIFKNLSMAKIGKIRPSLQSKIPIITPILIQLYMNYFNEWTESLDFGIMEIGYLSLKVLKRIIVDIFDSSIEHKEIMEFLCLSIKHFELLTNNYDNYQPSEFLEKYIKRYLKIYYLLTKSNPVNLIILPSSKEILYCLLNLLQSKAELIYNNNQEDELLWEFTSIKILLIFKVLINFLFQKNTLTLKSRSNKLEIENSINFLKNEFFTENLIKSLTDLLINYYIKLNSKDLDNWINEPEDWVNDEINKNYEYQIRQCSENFFQDLINNFKTLLVPYVLHKIENELNNYSDSSAKNILIKDSIFTIFQLSSNSIFDIVDINNLFENIFLPESLKNDIIENKVLKRRICLLINEWLGLSNTLNDSNIDKIYQMLLNFQDSSNPINDKVVKLSSIQTLNSILSDWDFKKPLIKPYISKFIKNLLNLINEMELTESKLFLLNTIAILISKTNELITLEELKDLLNIIPKFWDYSNNSNELILKNSLLRILKNLIISLNNDSYLTWEISIPLIKVSCDSNSQFYSMLSEDGFELWLTLLQFYPIDYEKPNFNDELIQIFLNNFEYAILNQTEILPLILEIYRSYSILIPELNIIDNFKSFNLINFQIFKKYLKLMRDDSLDILTSILDLNLLSNYNNNENSIKYLNLLIESNLLNEMVELILDEDQSSLTKLKILLIVSRITFILPNEFFKFFKIYFNDNRLSVFLKIWFINLENVGNPRFKKIHILGLSSLLKTLNLIAFENFNGLIGLWITAFEEINEIEGDCAKYHENYLYEFKYDEVDLTIIENGEYKRFFKIIENNDPVHNLNLKKYINELLMLIKNSLGDQFNELIKNIDVNLLENLEYFLKL